MTLSVSTEMSGKAPCQQIMVRGGVIGQREAALTETVARLQRARRHLVPVERTREATLLELFAPDLAVLHAQSAVQRKGPEARTSTYLFRDIVTRLEALALFQERVHAADRVHVGLPHSMVLREGKVEQGVELRDTDSVRL